MQMVSETPNDKTSDSSHSIDAVTGDLSSSVERARSNQNIPGLSMGIVRLTQSGEVETKFGSWGKVTEEGLETTSQVRISPSFGRY